MQKKCRHRTKIVTMQHARQLQVSTLPSSVGDGILKRYGTRSADSLRGTRQARRQKAAKGRRRQGRDGEEEKEKEKERAEPRKASREWA